MACGIQQKCLLCFGLPCVMSAGFSGLASAWSTPSTELRHCRVLTDVFETRLTYEQGATALRLEPHNLDRTLNYGLTATNHALPKSCLQHYTMSQLYLYSVWNSGTLGIKP